MDMEDSGLATEMLPGCPFARKWADLLYRYCVVRFHKGLRIALFLNLSHLELPLSFLEGALFFYFSVEKFVGLQVILFDHLFAIGVGINESSSARDDKGSDCRFVVEFLRS